MYSFIINESATPGHLILVVSTNNICTDIFEGPYRIIMNRLTAYYDDTLRLRKVR